MKRFALALPCSILALLLLAGCSRSIGRPEKLSQETIDKHNEAVALAGKFEWVPAIKILEPIAKEYPDWQDAKVDLAIATLNRQLPGDEEEALRILGEVLDRDPKNLRAHYCTGLLLKYRGRIEEALDHFRIVGRADPTDGYAAFNVGDCLNQLGKPAEALKWFEQGMESDPYLGSVYYAAGQVLRRLKQPEKAKEVSAIDQRLRGTPQRREFTFAYTKMGPKSEIKAIDLPPRKPAKMPEGDLFAAPVPLPVSNASAVKWAKAGPESGSTPSITSTDLDGDGQSDLFLVAAIEGEGGPRNAVLMGRGEAYEVEAEHPLAGVTGIRAVLWGDYDNDGLVDVYFCRKGANQLWRQTEKGQWQDVTADSKTDGGDYDTVDGLLVDADHDGDLDIFLVNGDGPNELLSNNLDGTFRPLAADYGLAGDAQASRGLIVADFDNDRDADLLVINREAPHEVYENNRTWNYAPMEGWDALRKAKIETAAAADTDNDGSVEVYTLADGKLTRWSADQKRAWQPEQLEIAHGEKLNAATRLSIADLNGDGRSELLAGDSGQWLAIELDGKKGAVRQQVSGENQLAWSKALLDPSKGPAVVAMQQGAAPQVWQPGPGRFGFVAVRFAGVRDDNTSIRSNTSGIGTRANARIGLRWVSRSTYRESSGPGQSLEPVPFGLAGDELIDFLNIRWSDGVYQCEKDLKQPLVVISEVQRLPTSCPLLFTWNGTCYQFTTDLLGTGGLGYAVGPNEYASPDPTENYLLPPGSLAPQDGMYRIKMTEPGEEVTYLDAAQLVVYDLPPGWKMLLDERMGISEPLPTGEARFYRNEAVPAAAVNDRGEDVLEAIQTTDRWAAEPGQPDRRFVGRTAEHTLTLEFETPIESQPGEPMLIMDGWIEYPYSQTVFAAWQAGATFDPPTLEARDEEGHWRVVYEKFGYPAGMPRQAAVPLKNLPAGTKALRLRTNQQIYWDRLAIAYAQPCPEARQQRLPLGSARLRASGFAKRTVGAQHVPHFDYDRRSPVGDATHIPGMYTAYGAVEELVGPADSAVAIFGPGEEVHLEFPAPKVEPASGWTRQIVLETIGWCKDMDLYTGDGETVGPLPIHGSLTPEQLEARERLHEKYNIRYQAGP